MCLIICRVYFRINETAEAPIKLEEEEQVAPSPYPSVIGESRDMRAARRSAASPPAPPSARTRRDPVDSVPILLYNHFIVVMDQMYNIKFSVSYLTLKM